MNSFQVILPSLHLAPYISQYWFLSVDEIANGKQRVIPSGYMGLCFNRGEKIYSADGNCFPAYYIFGQASSYVDTYFSSLDLIIVIFRPMGAKAFFNLPLDELNGSAIGFDILDNPLIAELGKRIVETRDNQTCIELIENSLMRCFIEAKGYNVMRVASAVKAINQGESNVVELARSACLSYKQFQRVFAKYTGLKPKEYIRIGRFSKALHTLQTEPDAGLSELADRYGYFDKSHLIKDMKSLSGYTPGEFLANTDPYSEYKSLFQSVCVDIK